MRQTICLGFLGAGAWGRSKHLPALDYLRRAYTGETDLRLTALCERDSHQAQIVARQYGFEKTYHELAAFQSDPDVNCYSVVIGPDDLPEVLVGLAKRGIPLLTEKPPGHDVETASYLARRVTCPHVVAFNRRYFPIVEQFRTLLDACPDVYFVDCCMTRHARYDSAVDPAKRHGVVPFVVGTAVHTINLLEHLFGEIRDCDRTAIQADGSPAWLTDLRFSNGVHGRMRVLPCTGSMTEWLEVHSPRRSFYLRYSMYGSDYPGRIDIHENGKLVRSIDGDAGAHRLVNEGIVGEYRELFSLVGGSGTSRSTLAGSVNTMRIAGMIEP